jgi:glucose/arabinose dehydrogenase
MSEQRVTRRRALASAAAVAGLAGCSGFRSTGSATTPATATPSPTEAYDLSVPHDETTWAGYDPEWTAPATTPETDLSVEVVVENLEIPWDLSFAGNGDLFITERTGRVLRYRDGEVVGSVRPADAIDAGSVAPGSDEGSWFLQGGEGGTMGVAAHPRYPDPPVVYVYYTAETGDGRVNRLAAVDVAADDPGGTAETLLEVPANNYHDGGRIAFGPADHLWVTTGDAGEKPLAADPGSLAGKVLRVTPTGDPAPDNPGLEAPEVFTVGHRNPQGISWLPDATPLADEHGPGPDEVNRLVAGDDYGWPAARKPEGYAETDYHRPLASSMVEATVWAPSGSCFYTGSVEPLANRLLVGCLGSQRLKVFTVTPPEGELPPLGDTGTRYDADWLDGAYTVTSHDALVDRLGRIRHVDQGPDGALYAITSNRDGRASGAFPRERDDVLVRIDA